MVRCNEVCFFICIIPLSLYLVLEYQIIDPLEKRNYQITFIQKTDGSKEGPLWNRSICSPFSLW